MDSVCIMALLFILGAMLGSFGCCQMWRIHKKDKTKWSHCVNCKKRIVWYDNIPIVSWLFLKGKCRYCWKPIGWMEFLAEVGMAIVFVLSFVFWPGREKLLTANFTECFKYAAFLVNLVLWLVMLLYDIKWKELPVWLMLMAIFVSVAYLVMDVGMAYGLGKPFDWLNLGGALLVLPGFYYLMYRVSKEKWVGGGDWILCISLAIILEDFWLALFTLFAANIVGSLVSVPILMKNKNAKTVVPFGPFLIAGFLIVFFLQAQILRLVMI